MPDQKRRLAAILIADVVGYSRLMSDDEEATVAVLVDRREVFRERVENHNGRVVDTAGDSVLSVFDSVVEAVRCAVEIQTMLSERNAELSEDRRMQFRIGVNLGDIIEKEDGTVYGDGVNIAARMEALADPGGVTLSDDAYRQVRAKLEVTFEDMGDQDVKNIAEPIRAFRMIDPERRRAASVSQAPSVRKKLDVVFDDLGEQSVKNISTLVHAHDVRWEGEAGTPHDRAVKPTSKRRRLAFIAGALVLVGALGFVVVNKLDLGLDNAVEVTEAVLENSIAVLPFVNMSDDASNEYFSDGLSEELLNLLAKMTELRVTARTSSFSYKGKDVRIDQIGKELNVAYILEGSVRRAGNQVRITAQLIRSHDESRLWSETYDRTLDDIFAIQDEIASEVVAQLKITLLGDVPTVKKTDPEAYALFLQARHLSHQTTPDAYEQSIALFQQALEIDPDYAAAWEGLAGNYMSQASVGLRPINEGHRLAREVINRALAIDPAYAPAHANLGRIARAYDGDLAAAARHYEHALELDPADMTILSDAATLTSNLGRVDEAIVLREYATVRDPVNPRVHHSLSVTYRWAGRLDEAITSARTALSLSPGRIGTQYQIGVALLLKGEPDAALAAMPQELSEGWRLLGLVMVHHALGQASESDVALAAMIDRYEQEWAYNIAYALAYRGEADRTFDWLDKAVQYKDPGLSQIPNQNLFSSIHDDPRWLPFLESIGKSPEQLAAIKFEVTLPE